MRGVTELANEPTTKQLTRHIDEGIAMEQGVLRMLDTMLKTTRDVVVQKALDEHKRTTRRHVERLEERLSAHGARRSVPRQAGGIVLSRGKVVVDLLRPQKAGRNARDGFATEQMEVAAYELLERLARRAGDEETADVARQNRAEDEAMAALIARNWDTFAEQSVAGESSGGRTEALKQRAKTASGLLRNPVVLGLGSVAGGLLLGRRFQSKPTQEGGAVQPSRGRPLAALSKPELQSRASEAGIEVKRSMTKQDLIEALEQRAGGRAGGAAKASPFEIQAFLAGVQYPASRDQLRAEAERQGADERVLRSLERLPPERFERATEVSEAIGESQ